VIVLGASIVVELLMNGALADTIRDNLAQHDDSLLVPHLLDVEVASAFRNLAAGRRIDSHRSAQIAWRTCRSAGRALRAHAFVGQDLGTSA
jgi:predicted nucleic acid-binding protein